MRARDLLLAPTPGHRRLTAEALREALVDLHEFWLSAHAARAGMEGPGGGVALVAVGALGRRELVPYSDLDLVLVHDGKRDVDAIAERLWYPLWNAGIGLDHSVRTVGEALRVATEDMRTALGLLEARHLGGDPEVSSRLVTSAWQAWRTGIRDRLDGLVETASRRWAKFGEIAQRMEPDIKHGRGGLRDFQLLDALASAQVADRPSGEVLEARALLLDVRTELRRAVGRPRDVVLAQDGDEIAAALNIGDRFDLARALSGAGRTVAYAVDVSVRAARAATPKRGLSALSLRRGPVRKPLDEGVVLHGTEVALAKDADPSRDPALLLRVAGAAARTGAPIATSTLAKLADWAPELRKPWPEEARTELVALLGAGPGLVDVVEALDRTGLWGRLFPEWGAVRDLPARDIAHLWTVDRHLVQATAQAAKLVTTVSRPDLLLLGALLHDIGKGATDSKRGKGRDDGGPARSSSDHSVVGAALAIQIGERLGLPAEDVATLSGMVRHHLLLPHTATRRDVEDPATVERVADTVGRDPVLLELLHALAEADSRATANGVWSDWKAGLIGELVVRCRAVMAGEALPKPEPLNPQQTALAQLVAESGRTDVLISESGYTAAVTVVAVDRPGLLSRTAGVLALNSLEVHGAALRSHAGVACDVFHVSPKFGKLPDPALLREQLHRSLDDSFALTDKLAAKERDYGGPPEFGAPPKIVWYDDEASGASILELRAADRIGLLYHVAAALESCGLDVRWARVSTFGGTVVDSFCVTSNGNATLTTAERRKIERAVLSAAS